MPSDFTATGAARLLTSFTGTGAVGAQDMWMMLLKSTWITNIPTPRTTTTSATWTNEEATFGGYARIKVVGTPDRMGTPTDDGTVVSLKTDQACVWTSNAASPTNTIGGAALVNTASGAITGVYAFSSFDQNQSITASGQTIVVDVNDFIMQVG